MEANNFNSSLRKHTQLTHKSKSICYASQGQRQSLFLLCLSSVVFSHTRFALIWFLCMLRRELWNMFERRTTTKKNAKYANLNDVMCFLFRRTHKSQIDGQSVNGSFDGIEYINEQYDSDELQVC